MPRWVTLVGCALMFALTIMGPARPAHAGVPEARDAEALYRSALSRLEQDETEARRTAMQELDQATHLDGTRPELWLLLGRLCIQTGQGARGRGCLKHCAALTPTDSAAQLELGLAWKQEWLDSFDRSSLEQAESCVSRACAAAPAWAESWTALALLRVLEGRPADGLVAATHARACDPADAEPGLALGCACYRLGALAGADSAFRFARARLGPDWLQTVELIAGRGEEGAGASPAALPWPLPDPDLTTPENEAELDFMTRAALALFVFRDRGRLRWDKRAELFLRYGPPGSVVRNPVEAEQEYVRDRHVKIMYAPDPVPVQYSAQAWHYPELGIDVMLWDASLTGVYGLPVSENRDLDPKPDPRLLAGRTDLVALANGRGVFRAMPPGAQPMVTRGGVTRFPDSTGAHLLAHVIVAAEPTDSLWGAWAVIDSAGRVVRRGGHALSASACDPAAQQVADFDASLRPGRYRIDMSVSGVGSRRGLVRLHTAVAAPRVGLAMSDLVLVCGDQATSVGPGGIRIEPNLTQRVAGGGALTAYFELNRLALGADGSARFAYHYSIRRPGTSDQPDKPGESVFDASREESHASSLRRQFITAPLKSIAPGAYVLAVEVRDLVSGDSVAGSVRFVKE